MEELIEKYFPRLSSHQKEMLSHLVPLYTEWNSKINVVSRKDIQNIHLHHILHSMSVARHTNFPSSSRVLDVGTGGGFPGIPLAIMFPESHFYLCDSRNKKITVIKEIIKELNISNATPLHTRAEEIDKKFHYVVSRAVTELENFIPWVWDKIIPGGTSEHNGIIYLKGGDLAQEIKAASAKNKIKLSSFQTTDISTLFEEEWFKGKSILFIKR